MNCRTLQVRSLPGQKRRELSPNADNTKPPMFILDGETHLEVVGPWTIAFAGGTGQAPHLRRSAKGTWVPSCGCAGHKKLCAGLLPSHGFVK